MVQGLQPWYETEAADDHVILNVHVQTSDGSMTTEADAEEWRDRYGLTFTVLADPAGWWAENWGAAGRGSQHSYVVIDSSYRISWRLGDGSSVSAEEVISQAEAAE